MEQREYELFRESPALCYSHYERYCTGPYRRRCIDGRITGSGNCVAYCRFQGHPGFLTMEQRKRHNCIRKGCRYYVPKLTRRSPTKTTSDGQALQKAEEVFADYEGMRPMRVEHGEAGWLVYYICITRAHCLPELEKKLSAALGNTATLILLNYDFERAANLIFNEK